MSQFFLPRAISVVLAALIIFLVSGLIGCDAPAELPTVSASFVRQDGSETDKFVLEVAANDSTRAKGLMFRKEMGERKGMLFLFPQERVNSFWMKNTILSLDMLFVAANWRIVGILQKVPPQNEEQRQVDSPSQYVVELGAGVTEKYHVTKGDLLKIHDTLPAVH